jgi:hypothetical protein
VLLDPACTCGEHHCREVQVALRWSLSTNCCCSTPFVSHTRSRLSGDAVQYF